MIKTMKMYPIPREDFVKLFSKVFDKYYVYFYDSTLEFFKVWRYDDSYYILHLDSGILITWYKHLGRCLQCNSKLTIKDYKYLSEILYEDMEEYFK